MRAKPLVFLGFLLLSYLVSSGYAISSIGNSSSASATAATLVMPQRKLFTNQTVYPHSYLAFPSNGTDAIECYSLDNGTTWANASSLAFIAGLTGGQAFDVKIRYNGSTLYVYSAWFNSSGGTGYIYFRRDTLGNDGYTLTRGTEYLAYSASQTFSNPVLDVNTNGMVFIGIGRIATTTGQWTVVRNPNNDGSGSWTAQSWSLGIGNNYVPYGGIISLTSGKAYTVWGTTFLGWVRGSLWNGTAWSPFGNSTTFETVDGSGEYYSWWSLNAWNDNVYFDYTNTSIIQTFRVRNSTTNLWSLPEASSTTIALPGTLTVNITTGDAYFFYPSEVYRNRIYYRIRYVNGTYGTETYFAQTYTTIPYGSLSPLIAMVDNFKIGILWTWDAGSYEVVQFNELDYVPSGGATSLGVSGIASISYAAKATKTVEFNRQGTSTLMFTINVLRQTSFYPLGSALWAFATNKQLSFSFGAQGVVILAFTLNSLKTVMFDRQGNILLTFNAGGTILKEVNLNFAGQALLQFTVNLAKAFSLNAYGTSLLAFTTNLLRTIAFNPSGVSTLTFSANGINTFIQGTILNVAGSATLTFLTNLFRTINFNPAGNVFLQFLANAASSFVSASFLNVFGSANLLFSITIASMKTIQDIGIIIILFFFILVALALGVVYKKK